MAFVLCLVAPATSAAAVPESSPSSSEREFVNYQSESASDHTPMREVDPMDELSDFEQPDDYAQSRRPTPEPAPVAADVGLATESPPPPPPSSPLQDGTNGGDFDMADRSVGADEDEQAQGDDEEEEEGDEEVRGSAIDICVQRLSVCGC